ncbi:MAG: undecaprenyl-diphosphate phosphatase, partial [Acidimicrobiia bacterium]|nr:undecaprenyl-diphosphate phosphatase [Acidimicrobiia bacterium]
MLEPIIWGLVQGLTEFLPVSSSGHLVLVPSFLDLAGFEIDPPSLATSAVLHLGTLVAVLTYFRDDVARVLRMRSDPEGRRIALLVAVGTVPAAIGLLIESRLEAFQDDAVNVGIALMLTGVILAVGHLSRGGLRTLDSGRLPDAIAVGIAQAFALIPGISRSGITITAGLGRKFEAAEAARFAFLLGIPAIAAAGVTQLGDVAVTGAGWWELGVGLAVAAVSGYAAIAGLLTALRKVGLLPFAG